MPLFGPQTAVGSRNPLAGVTTRPRGYIDFTRPGAELFETKIFTRSVLLQTNSTKIRHVFGTRAAGSRKAPVARGPAAYALIGLLEWLSHHQRSVAASWCLCMVVQLV